MPQSKDVNSLIFDVNECPPKVSLRVSSASETNATGEIIEYNLVNNN